MSRRSILVVAALWVASLFLVGGIAVAQARGYTPLPEPKIVTGPDVGFRIEGTYGDMPAGALVVRVNGQWVEARLAPQGNPHLISAR